MWTLLCNCSYCSTSSVSRAGISKNEMRRHWTARKRGIRFPSRSCTDDGRVCQLCKVFSRRSLNSKCVDGHDWCLVWHAPNTSPRRHPNQMPKPPQLSFFDVEDQQPSKISTDGKNLGVLNDQLFPEWKSREAKIHWWKNLLIQYIQDVSWPHFLGT